MTSALVPLEANPPGRPPLDRPPQAYHDKWATVDHEDAARVLAQRWTLHKVRSELYAKQVGHNTILLHRFVLELPKTPTKWDVVDHINHDGLDCRRANLRIASNIENLANSASRPGTSKFKGVCWDHSRGRWLAQIMINERNHYLGRFKDEAQAALAYNKAAFGAWGEFAQLNDIDPDVTLPPPHKQSSQYRGVYWIQRNARWRVSIKVDGKDRYFGHYTSEREAALAYNEAAKAALGDKARLNVVTDA